MNRKIEFTSKQRCEIARAEWRKKLLALDRRGQGFFWDDVTQAWIRNRRA